MRKPKGKWRNKSCKNKDKDEGEKESRENCNAQGLEAEG